MRQFMDERPPFMVKQSCLIRESIANRKKAFAVPEAFRILLAVRLLSVLNLGGGTMSSKKKGNNGSNGTLDPRAKAEITRKLSDTAQQAGVVLKVKGVKGYVLDVSLTKPDGRPVRAMQINVTPQAGVDVVQLACETVRETALRPSGTAEKAKRKYGAQPSGRN
jgi:hypothetical protein